MATMDEISKGIPKGLAALATKNTSRTGKPLLNQSRKAEYAQSRLQAHTEGKAAASPYVGPGGSFRAVNSTRGFRARQLSRVQAKDLGRTG